MFTELLDRQPLVGAVRRTAGRVLRSQAVAVATAPHGVDRYLEQLRPTWVGDEVRARVVAVRPEAPDVVTLTLRPGRGWPGAAAGQHVRVGVELDGRRRTRSFSLASSAHRTDGCIEITVKAHADGVVSRHLVDHAAAGLTVALSAPGGDFTLPATRPERLLLLSGGSGITPVMAMLRTLCDEGHDRPVTFLHYARTQADVIFATELARIAEDHPTVDVRVVLTGEAATDAALSGRFCAEHLASLGADLDEVEAYACGPVGLVDAVLAHWDAAGATERLHVERFSLVPVAPGEGEVGGEVRFTATGTTVAGDGRPLLVLAEAAGLAPAHGCRMGICHTCTRRKESGVVRDLRTGALSSADEEPIQICVSVPTGDVAVDL